MDFNHVFIFLLLKVILPLHVEFLQSFITDLDIILELSVLDIGAQFVLVGHYFYFEHADLLH